MQGLPLGKILGLIGDEMMVLHGVVGDHKRMNVAVRITMRADANHT